MAFNRRTRPSPTTPTSSATDTTSSYIADRTTNARRNSQAAYLALANVTALPGHETGLTPAKSGLRVDKPFRVSRYTSIIIPRVTLGKDGATMQVTGWCGASILAHCNGEPVNVTFRRTSFTYYIEATPCQAYPVAVGGWNAISKASGTDR